MVKGQNIHRQDAPGFTAANHRFAAFFHLPRPQHPACSCPPGGVISYAARFGTKSTLMCGIVGATAARNIVPILVEGLKRLEYRGYDSGGIAVLENGDMDIRRAVGTIEDLIGKIEARPLQSGTGIAHTRWATHGGPTVANAHPHRSANHLALVQNGIVENHEPLRAELLEAGFEFASQTDTEVAAHLVARFMREGKDFGSAFRQAVKRLRGSFALAAISPTEPETIWLACMGSPLAIGISSEENYVASDPLALLQVTDRFIHLKNGDLARVDRNRVQVFDISGQPVTRAQERYIHAEQAISKGNYRHYMLKEIHEQPRAVADTLADKIGRNSVLVEALGPEAENILPDIENIHIIACGTSYHAGLVARYWIESAAGIPVSVEVASEYCYRAPVTPPGTLFIGISQSGETADTLAALRHAQSSSYLATLALCNMPGSTLVRQSQLRLITEAGVEIGVASTKAFTTQLAALRWLALTLARSRGRLSDADEKQAVDDLRALPEKMRRSLALEDQIMVIAEEFIDKQHALFLGRGAHFPIAMEGALKLKEISYIHAEAYPAGELKHGPLALVDEDMPVVTVAPDDHLLDKLRSNIEEVSARGGQLINFVADSIRLRSDDNITNLQVPGMSNDTSPIMAVIPLQLLAYHVALLKGTDVDRPRNLAKSVTVE